MFKVCFQTPASKQSNTDPKTQTQKTSMPFQASSSCQNSVIIYLARAHFEIMSFKVFLQRPEILQLVPMQHAADVIIKSQIFCLSQRGRGRLTRQRSARFLTLFEFSKYQGARFLAINVYP